MKFPTLVTKVIEKTAPISVVEKDDIEKNCNLWYEKKYQDAKSKSDSGQELTLIDKIFFYGDQWYCRIGFTILYFVAVRWIQDLMNPADDDDGHDQK